VSYRSLLVALIWLGAAACVLHRPAYQFEQGETRASLLVMSGDHVELCKDGTWYDQEADEWTHVAWVPAGRRITVGQKLSFLQDTRTSYHCHPKLSFLPEPGAAYVLEAELVDRRCMVAVVQANPATLTGLSLLHTVGAPAECAEPARPEPSPTVSP